MTDAIITKGRHCQKHDTEENWKKAVNFAPLVGEIIVYDPDETYTFPRFKVGIWDGIEEHKTEETLINNLPFSSNAYVKYETLYMF